MSDDLTFQDTPLYAWLKTNMWYLLGGLGLFLAILLYRESAPRWKHASLAESWQQYRSLSNAPDGLEKLPTHLAAAKEDERIHEWVVYGAARAAAETADADALALLKPELESLAKSSNVMVAGPTGAQRLAEVLLGRVYEGVGVLPKDAAAPAPDGGRVKFTLSVDGTSTYDVVFGLYETQAPTGTAALKAWIDAGRLEDQTARRAGAMTLNLVMDPVSPGTEEEPEAKTEPLMIERQFGYFHSEGTLSTGMLPGKAGEQDQNNLQLALQNAYNLDGQTTVLGKAVEGLQALKDALAVAPPTAVIKVVSAKVLE